MKETTGKRLRLLMSERGLKQVDILRMCEPYCEKYGMKLAKSGLSQYVSDKVQPKQDMLSILGMALNVSEAWLMGYDVSRNRDVPAADSDPDVTAEAGELSRMISFLPHDKQLELRDYIQYLLSKA